MKDSKLILNESKLLPWSSRISFVPYRTYRGPLFPKPVTGQELFFAVSYSKPALVFDPFGRIVIWSQDWRGSLMFATSKRIWPCCTVSQWKSFLNLLGLLGPIYFFCMIFYIFLQSHSIHGMNDEGTGNKPYKEMGTLTYEEKKFLLAVERGDVASVRR